MNNLKILPKMCRFFLSVFSVILILGLCLLLYTDFIFQISNNSQFQHYNLGWYISNTKQLRIEALQIWLIYFKYHTTQQASLQSWLIYFKYQTTQELRHYNLGWYISNIKQLRIAALPSWFIYFKYQTTQNCSITILVDIFQVSNN